MLRAALFDFDGTLVDTTDLIYQSMRHASGEVLGREISREVLMANVGQPLPRQMELLSAEHAGALLDSYRLHNEENHDALIKEFPGVEEALARLRWADVQVAVVTSKRRFSVDMALKNLPGLGEVVERLLERRFVLRYIPGSRTYVRASTHLFNSEEELEALAKAVGEL